MQARKQGFWNNSEEGWRNPKSEISKSETNSKFKCENLKIPVIHGSQFLRFVSDFDIRISDFPLRHFHPPHLVGKILGHDHPRGLVDEGQILRQIGHGENIADADLVLGPQGGFHRVGLDRLAAWRLRDRPRSAGPNCGAIPGRRRRRRSGAGRRPPRSRRSCGLHRA